MIFVLVLLHSGLVVFADSRFEIDTLVGDGRPRIHGNFGHRFELVFHSLLPFDIFGALVGPFALHESRDANGQLHRLEMGASELTVLVIDQSAHLPEMRARVEKIGQRLSWPSQP